MAKPIKIGQLPRGRLIDKNGQPTTVFLLWLQQQVQEIVAQKTDVVPNSSGALAKLDSYGNLASSGKVAPGSDIVGTTDIQTLSNKTLVTPLLVVPTIGDFTNAEHNHHNAQGAGQLDEDSLLLSDVTTNNASATNHGFLPKLPGDVTEFLNGNGAWQNLNEDSLILSDITDNNASATKHGFLPKLSNSDNDLLNGKGLWETGYTGTVTVVTAVGPPVLTATLTFKAGQLLSVA